MGGKFKFSAQDRDLEYFLGEVEIFKYVPSDLKPQLNSFNFRAFSRLTSLQRVELQHNRLRQVIYLGELTTKPLNDREFQFAYICSLLSNTQFIRCGIAIKS